MFVKVLFFVFFWKLLKETRQIVVEDYCKFNEKNLPCDTKCKIDENCHYIGEETSEYNRQLIPLVLNGIRNELASGKNPRKFPTAANMNAISYDMECEFLAKCYSNLCTFNTMPFMISLSGEVVGYRVYGIRDKKMDAADMIVDAILTSWYNQYKHIPKFDVWHKKTFLEDYINSGKKFEGFDFLQVIWAKTKYVGCARSHFIVRGVPAYTFVCAFKPSGNLDNELAYEVGPPRGLCNSSDYNENFPSLCGVSRPLEDDKYEAPLISKAITRIPNLTRKYLYLFLVLKLW